MPKIIAHYDFVHGRSNVEGATKRATLQSAEDHGTATTSVAGGRADGALYGPAFDAGYLLAKTEDVTKVSTTAPYRRRAVAQRTNQCALSAIHLQETPIEEDYYVAGLEWGEALGTDVVSSSVGYSNWWLYPDLDGKTSKPARAVDAAVERSVVVVQAAGNRSIRGLDTPADAQNAITVGAVTVAGELAIFSALGPTIDGRIKVCHTSREAERSCAHWLNTYISYEKPDTCAMGFQVKVANYLGEYKLASGYATREKLVISGGNRPHSLTRIYVFCQNVVCNSVSCRCLCIDTTSAS